MVTKKPRIVVIGAGMAGLTAANKLYTSPNFKQRFELVVVEGDGRIGGRINSSEFYQEQIERGATWIHGIESDEVMCGIVNCDWDSVGSVLREGLEAYWGLEGEKKKKSVNGVGNWSRKALEEAIFAMHKSIQRTFTSADDLCGQQGVLAAKLNNNNNL